MRGGGGGEKELRRSWLVQGRRPMMLVEGAKPRKPTAEEGGAERVEQKAVPRPGRVWTMQSVRSPICQQSASGPLRPRNTAPPHFALSSTHISCPHAPSCPSQCTSVCTDFFCHRTVAFVHNNHNFGFQSSIIVDSLKNGATLTSAGRNVSLHDFFFFLHKFAFIFFIESCWWTFMCKTILRDELINQPQQKY